MIKIVDNTAFLVMKRAVRNTREGIRRGFMEVAPSLQADVIRGIINPPKTGRLYNVGGSLHRASAPGEFPANLSGKLARSVRTRMLGTDQLELSSNTEYAAALEYGKKDGTLKPRPHIRPVGISRVRDVQQSILRNTERELSKK